ncbi:poly-gamma-glutamate synthase PgsB [Halobacillus sp. B23F22_1]|uniref:poly-gamma-glutamate synthase PgsB n=1 Tax=Halobacillus sp. B23F22_1 TaxID=3459514 RepID=UPI00373F5173
MNELTYLLIFAVIVVVLGLRERITLDRKLKQIPTRVLINGIRGKSTVTRLVMGILKENGDKVIGKTTGTSARMFYWDSEEEEPIIRGLQGPNISEQRKMVHKVTDRKAEAFVSECMAVHPVYQKIFQERLVKSNITIITNVMEDHLDVMGPTLDDIAQAFSSTIPRNGYLIIPETPYQRFFEKAARKKNTKVIVADESEIDENYLKKFPFMIFPQNAALALAVADILQIDREVALKGMLTAPVDPGAMRVHTFGDAKSPKYFFNGFAANDVTSTLNIWERIKEQGYPTEDVTVVMNCRHDRVERTIEFAEKVLPHMDIDRLVVIGKEAHPILTAYDEGNIRTKHIVNLEKQPIDKAVDYVAGLPKNALIYGVGNIHGGGEEFAEAIEKKEHSPARLHEESKKESSFSVDLLERKYQTNK